MKLFIFSGTSEGRSLCQFVAAHQISAQVYVATDYGQAVMEPMQGITVHIGRLTADEIEQKICKDALVVDATHPYATEITQNLQIACHHVQAQYLRLIRPAQIAEDVITVANTAEAVNWICNHKGHVLLTTGSKELDAYTAVPDYQKRIFPRVLPSTQVLAKCEALGFPGSSVIAMQGPFSHEMNVALLEKINAKILITKDTGSSGGFEQKLSAARQVGAQVIVIARPTDEHGYTLEQIQNFLYQKLECKQIPRFPLFISLVNQSVLVVGAGKIAARRIAVLQQFGAMITIVAPKVSKMIDLTHVKLHKRIFQTQDLNGACLVIAVTNDRMVNHEIAVQCHQKNIPVSVADCAEESTFYFPAVCIGKKLVAGIVSDGSDHHAVAQTAKKIRTLLE